LDDDDDDEVVVDIEAPSNQTSSIIVNHNYEPNEYSDYVPPTEQVQLRYMENFISVESYATDSNCTDLDSISSKTLYPLNVDHLSHISFVSNTFLSEPNPCSSTNVNSTNNFDQNSSNSNQSFGNSVYATLTTVKANSISNVNSNIGIQFNSEQANYNHSLNISTFNPNPSLLDNIDEDIDDDENFEVEKASQVQVQAQGQVQVQAQVSTTKRRGRPPLSLEEVERRATLKANEKLKKQASKRAKTT
jgi:hypothetical protein